MRVLGILLVLVAARVEAAPLFAEATANLGAPQPCGGTGCYSHYVVLADLDGDDDLDIVFASGGGYYAVGSAQTMAVYLGDGAGQFSEVNATALGGFTGRVRQVAVGDIDGDGDLDVIAPDSWAMQPDAVFVNDGAQPPVFANEGAARGLGSSRAAGARLGDLDGDGDLDLVLTDWGTSPPGSVGTAHVYLNDGTGVFAERAGAVPADLSAQGTGPIDVDLFDADGDFDLDLMVASREGESLLLLNDGAASFTDAGARLPDQPGPYVYGPEECDVDGDGDLDVWLDNGAAQLREQLVINDGAGNFVDETATRVAMNPGADDNEVQCADVDGDGDLDAIVASLSNEERVLVNDGTGHFAGVTDAFPALGDPTLGLDLGDVNGDGRLDAVTAQGESTPLLNRLYLGLPAAAVDTRAPVIRAVEDPVTYDPAAPSVAIRFGVWDASTTDVGPRLAEARVEIDGGAAHVATFVGGDLFRAVIPVAAPQVPIRYRACAKDRANNEACSEYVTITAAAPADAGGPGSADAAPGGADAGSTGGGDDDGCGCRVGRGAAGGAGLAVLLLGALLAVIARRKTQW